MSIKADVKKVINLIKKGWARNCLFRDKGNREINVGAGTLDTLIYNSGNCYEVDRNKKKICKCCLEGAIFLASKNPLQVERYLKNKIKEIYLKEQDLAEFNDCCTDKRQVLRFLEKTI